MSLSSPRKPGRAETKGGKKLEGVIPKADGQTTASAAECFRQNEEEEGDPAADFIINPLALVTPTLPVFVCFSFFVRTTPGSDRKERKDVVRVFVLFRFLQPRTFRPDEWCSSLCRFLQFLFFIILHARVQRYRTLALEIKREGKRNRERERGGRGRREEWMGELRGKRANGRHPTGSVSRACCQPPGTHTHSNTHSNTHTVCICPASLPQGIPHIPLQGGPHPPGISTPPGSISQQERTGLTGMPFFFFAGG